MKYGIQVAQIMDAVTNKLTSFSSLIELAFCMKGGSDLLEARLYFVLRYISYYFVL